MGVFIYLSVSKSVTQVEWEPVYQEALELARKLNLAEARRMEIGGVEVPCLAVTQERTRTYGWRHETWTGFEVTGDYETLQSAETNSFPRYLPSCERKHEYQDAMLETYRDEHDRKYDGDIYNLLGAKTQGYSHHIPLLAVCCLIEDRLGNRAYIYGDISAGQCRRAVELANQYLIQPIALPDACDAGRLIQRIQAMPIGDEEKFRLLDRAYLGRKNKTLGEAMRAGFGEELCYRYWAGMFETFRVDMNGFSGQLRDYLDMDFSLERFFTFYSFRVDGEEDERELFVQKLLKTGLCSEEKNTSSSIFDPEREIPYGVGDLFAQLLLHTEEARMTDAYLPLDVCCAILKRCMDCPALIDKCAADYRERMEAEAAVLAKGEIYAERYAEETDGEAKYDLEKLADLEIYKSGMSIAPDLISAGKQILKRFGETIEEEGYTVQAQKTPQERFAFLAANISLPLRDRDWEKIYRMVQSQDFRRYYPAACLRVTHPSVACAVRALLVNDDLYELMLENWEGENA